MVDANPLSKDLYGACGRKLWLAKHHIAPIVRTSSQSLSARLRKGLTAMLLQELGASTDWEIFALHPKTKAPIEFKSDELTVRMSALARSKTLTPAQWFLIESQSVTDVVLAQVIAHKLEIGYPGLYGHCMLGMGFAKLMHCAVFLVGDCGDTYLEVLEFDEGVFENLVEVAAMLSGNLAPAPEKVDECDTCQNNDTCFDHTHVDLVNCYSCHYCTLGNGGVNCRLYKRIISPEDALGGCTEHLFNPSLVKWGTFLGAQHLENGHYVHLYEVGDKQLRNCGAKALQTAPKVGPMYTSHEIFIGGTQAISSPQVQAIKEQFAGSKIIQS